MKFNNATAEILVPDGVPAEQALPRTTHLGIGAHQDDLEIMALHGILECFDAPDRWFCGVTCTDGAGSARTGPYADFTNQQIQNRRHEEQRQAASIGRYGAMIQLDYASFDIKSNRGPNLESDLRTVIELASPEVIYTHNPADKHQTHIAVFLAVIRALRSIPPENRPAKVLGCEGWRSLDWIPDRDKVFLDVSGRENLVSALVGVYDSQISGGKRVDLASQGRMQANATFLESHSVDSARRLIYCMDLTPLIRDDSLDLIEFVCSYIDRLKKEVTDSFKQLCRTKE